MTKRILILGAGGLLGHKLCQVLAQKNHVVYGTLHYSSEFYQTCTDIYNGVTLLDNIDALDETSLNDAIISVSPEVIVNAIGIVKQLEAAENAYFSVGLNAFLPHRLTYICEQINARLIHISTDCVFNGKQGQYSESSLSDAEDLYGKSKFLGETSASDKHAITLRTSIIGHELKPPMHGLLEWVLSQRGQTINGFKNAYFSGFTSNELAKIINMVVEEYPELYGMYHVASQRISKYDLLKLIDKQYQLRLNIQAEEIFYCDRSLIMQRFSKATNYQAPSWSKMIAAMHEDSKVYQNLSTENIV